MECVVLQQYIVYIVWLNKFIEKKIMPDKKNKTKLISIDYHKSVHTQYDNNPHPTQYQ